MRFTHEQTINTIDFWELQQKPYDTVKQFEEDLKWFEHNCRTIFPHDHGMQEASKELIGYVKERIQIVQSCAECYESTHEYVKNSERKLCLKRHLLLWAKAPDCGIYWPAKVLAVNTQEQTVQVHFFGDFSWCTFPVGSCFLYSKESPQKKRGPHLKIYNKALDVSSTRFLSFFGYSFNFINRQQDVNKYIKHIRLIFGYFNYANPQTVFEPEKYADYLEQMIAEQPNSQYNATELDSDYADTADTNHGFRYNRKRKVRIALTNGARAKKRRVETDFGKISDSIARGLRSLNQMNDNNIQKIEKLQRDLDKVTNEKEGLEQQNDALNVEKTILEEMHQNAVKQFAQKMADAEEATRKAEKMLDDAKMEFMRKNAELQLALFSTEKIAEDEKDALEQRIAELEGNKTKNNCANCQKYVDSLQES